MITQKIELGLFHHTLLRVLLLVAFLVSDLSSTAVPKRLHTCHPRVA